MANRGKDTNGSQFFLTTKPAPHLDGVHVVFGKVLRGQEYVTQIENQRTDTKNRPLADVRITNCGELILKLKPKEPKKKKQASDLGSDVDSSSDNSDDDDNSSSTTTDSTETDSEEERRKRKKYRKKLREAKRRKKEKQKRKKVKKLKKDGQGEVVWEAQEMKSELSHVTINPQEIPEIPTHRFLMRGIPEKEKEEGSQQQQQQLQNKRTVDTSGRKIKGRGQVRYRMGNVSTLSRTPTPPHWRVEIQNRKALDDQQRSKWEKGQGDSPVRWERGAALKETSAKKRKASGEEDYSKDGRSGRDKHRRRSDHREEGSDESDVEEGEVVSQDSRDSRKRKHKKKRKSHKKHHHSKKDKHHKKSSSSSHKTSSKRYSGSHEEEDAEAEEEEGYYRHRRSYSRSDHDRYSRSRSRSHSHSRSRSSSSYSRDSRDRSRSRSRSRRRTRSRSGSRGRERRRHDKSSYLAARFAKPSHQHSDRSDSPVITSAIAMDKFKKNQDNKKDESSSEGESPPPTHWKPGQKPLKLRPSNTSLEIMSRARKQIEQSGRGNKLVAKPSPPSNLHKKSPSPPPTSASSRNARNAKDGKSSAKNVQQSRNDYVSSRMKETNSSKTNPILARKHSLTPLHGNEKAAVDNQQHEQGERRSLVRSSSESADSRRDSRSSHSSSESEAEGTLPQPEQREPEKKKPSKPAVKESFKWHPPSEDDEGSSVTAEADQDEKRHMEESFSKMRRENLNGTGDKEETIDQKEEEHGEDSDEGSLNERLDILTSHNEKIKEYVSNEKTDIKETEEEKEEGEGDVKDGVLEDRDVAHGDQSLVQPKDSSPREIQSPTTSSSSSSGEDGSSSGSGGSDSEEENGKEEKKQEPEKEGSNIPGDNREAVKENGDFRSREKMRDRHGESSDSDVPQGGRRVFMSKQQILIKVPAALPGAKDEEPPTEMSTAPPVEENARIQSASRANNRGPPSSRTTPKGNGRPRKRYSRSRSRSSSRGRSRSRDSRSRRSRSRSRSSGSSRSRSRSRSRDRRRRSSSRERSRHRSPRRRYRSYSSSSYTSYYSRSRSHDRSRHRSRSPRRYRSRSRSRDRRRRRSSRSYSRSSSRSSYDRRSRSRGRRSRESSRHRYDRHHRSRSRSARRSHRSRSRSRSRRRYRTRSRSRSFDDRVYGQRRRSRSRSYGTYGTRGVIPF